MNVPVTRTNPVTKGSVYQGSNTDVSSTSKGNQKSSYSPITAPQNSSSLLIDLSKISASDLDFYISFAIKRTGYADETKASDPEIGTDFDQKVLNCVKNNLNDLKLLENDDRGWVEYYALMTFAVMLESTGASINYEGSSQFLSSLKQGFSSYKNSPSQLVLAYVQRMNGNLQKLNDIKNEKTVFVSLGGKVKETDVPLGVSRLTVEKVENEDFAYEDNGKEFVLRLASGEDPLYSALIHMTNLCKKPLEDGQQIGSKEIRDMIIDYEGEYLDQNTQAIQGKIDEQREFLNKVNSNADIENIQKMDIKLMADITPAMISETGGDGHNLENVELLVKYFNKNEHKTQKKLAKDFIDEMSEFYGTKTDGNGSIIYNFDSEFKESWAQTTSTKLYKTMIAADQNSAGNIEFAQKLKFAMDIYNKYLQIAEIYQKEYSYASNVLGEKNARTLFMTAGALPDKIAAQKGYLDKLESYLEKIVNSYVAEKDVYGFGKNLLAREMGFMTPYDKPANDVLWNKYKSNFDLLEKGLLTYQNIPSSYAGQVGMAEEVTYTFDGGKREKGLLVDIGHPQNDPFIKELVSCLSQDQEIKGIIEDGGNKTDESAKTLSDILLRYGGRLPANVLYRISLQAYSPAEFVNRDQAIKTALNKIKSQISVGKARESLEAMVSGGKKLVLAYETDKNSETAKNLNIYYLEEGSLSGPLNSKDCFEVSLLKAMLISRTRVLDKDMQTDSDLISQLSTYRSMQLNAEESQPAEFLATSFKLLKKVVDKDKGNSGDEELKTACQFAMQVISSLLEKTSSKDSKGGLIRYLQGSVASEIENTAKKNMNEVIGQLDNSDKGVSDYQANAQKQIADLEKQINEQKEAARKQIDEQVKQLRQSAKEKGMVIDEKALNDYLKQIESSINQQVNDKIWRLKNEKLRIELNCEYNKTIIGNEKLDVNGKKIKFEKASELGGYIAEELISELGLSSTDKLDQNSILSAADQILGIIIKNYASLKGAPIFKDKTEKEYLVIDGPMVQALISEDANMSQVTGSNNTQGKTKTITLNPDNDMHDLVENEPILCMMLYLADQGDAPNPINKKQGLKISGVDYLDPSYIRALARWQSKLANNSPYKALLSSEDIRAINRVAEYVKQGRFFIDADLIKHPNEKVVLKNGTAVDEEATKEANQVLVIVRALYDVIQRLTQEADPKQQRDAIANQQGKKVEWQFIKDFGVDPITHSFLTMPTPPNRKAMESVDNTRVIGLKEILFKDELDAVKQGKFSAKTDNKPCHLLGADYFQGSTSISIGWDFIKAFVDNFEGYLTPAAINALIGTKPEKAQTENEEWALNNPKEFLNCLVREMESRDIIFSSLYFNVNDDQRLPDIKILVDGKNIVIRNPIRLAKRILQTAILQWDPGEKSCGSGLISKNFSAAEKSVETMVLGSTTYPYALVIKGYLIEKDYLKWSEGISLNDNKVNKNIAERAALLFSSFLKKYKGSTDEQKKLIESFESMGYKFVSSDKFGELMEYASDLNEASKMDRSEEYALTYTNMSGLDNRVANALKFFARYFVPMDQDQTRVSESPFNVGAVMNKLAGFNSGEVTIIHQSAPLSASFEIKNDNSDPLRGRGKDQAEEAIDQYFSLQFAMTPMISIQTQTAAIIQLPKMLIAAINGDTNSFSDAEELIRSLVNSRISLEAFRLNPYALLKDSKENWDRGNYTAAGIDLWFTYMAAMGVYELAKGVVNRGARRIGQSRTSFEGFELTYNEVPSSRLTANSGNRSTSPVLDNVINGTARGLDMIEQAVDYSIHPYDLIKKFLGKFSAWRNLTPAQKEFLKNFNEIDSEIVSGATESAGEGLGFEGMIRTAIGDKQFNKEFEITLANKQGKVFKTIILTSSDIIKIALDPKNGGAVSDALGNKLTTHEKKALVESLRASGEKVKEGMGDAELQKILKETKPINRKTVAIMKQNEFVGNLKTAAEYCKPGNRNTPLTITNGAQDRGIKMKGEDYINVIRTQVLQFRIDGFRHQRDINKPRRWYQLWQSRKTEAYNSALRSIYELNPIEEVMKNYPQEFATANGDAEACGQIYQNIIAEHLPNAGRFVQPSGLDKILLIEGLKISDVLPAIRKARYNIMIGNLFSKGGKTANKPIVVKTSEPVLNEIKPIEIKVLPGGSNVVNNIVLKPTNNTTVTKSDVSNDKTQPEKNSIDIKKEILAGKPTITKVVMNENEKTVVNEKGAPDNIYTVKKGDTLSSIAKANKTTVKKLLELNPDITDPKAIKPGQTLNLWIKNLGSAVKGFTNENKTISEIIKNKVISTQESIKTSKGAGDIKFIGQRTVKAGAMGMVVEIPVSILKQWYDGGSIKSVSFEKTLKDTFDSAKGWAKFGATQGFAIRFMGMTESGGAQFAFLLPAALNISANPGQAGMIAAKTTVSYGTFMAGFTAGSKMPGSPSAKLMYGLFGGILASTISEEALNKTIANSPELQKILNSKIANGIGQGMAVTMDIYTLLKAPGALSALFRTCGVGAEVAGELGSAATIIPMMLTLRGDTREKTPSVISGSVTDLANGKTISKKGEDNRPDCKKIDLNAEIFVDTGLWYQREEWNVGSMVLTSLGFETFIYLYKLGYIKEKDLPKSKYLTGFLDAYYGIDLKNPQSIKDASDAYTKLMEKEHWWDWSTDQDKASAVGDLIKAGLKGFKSDMKSAGFETDPKFYDAQTAQLLLTLFSWKMQSQPHGSGGAW